MNTALLVLAQAGLAAEKAAETSEKIVQADPEPWWNSILANALVLMIAFMFLSAIIGAFLSIRKRDRWLEKFSHFQVTVCEKTGRCIWGRLRVFSKGLEMLFTDVSAPADGQVSKQTFLYYESELAHLLLITRHVDEINEDPQQRLRRERQMHRMARPGLFVRIGRSLQNIVNTFRDAIVKSLGLVMSQTQKTTKSKVMKSGGGQMTGIGTMLVGEAGNAYEPMLEQYFGRKVVAEIVNPAHTEAGTVELCGYLGEYSAKYFLLVDCEHTENLTVSVPADGKSLLDRYIRGQLYAGTLDITHDGRFQATVTAIAWGETTETLSVDLTPGESTTMTLKEAPPAGTKLKVTLRVTRRMDLIAPRAIAVIRHRALVAEGAS